MEARVFVYIIGIVVILSITVRVSRDVPIYFPSFRWVLTAPTHRLENGASHINEYD